MVAKARTARVRVRRVMWSGDFLRLGNWMTNARKKQKAGEKAAETLE